MKYETVEAIQLSMAERAMPSVGEFLKQPQEDGERLDWLPQSVSEPVTIISARDAGAAENDTAQCLRKGP